jgi:hypothetical protein
MNPKLSVATMIIMAAVSIATLVMVILIFTKKDACTNQVTESMTNVGSTGPICTQEQLDCCQVHPESPNPCGCPCPRN